jgi:hypothetical protein
MNKASKISFWKTEVAIASYIIVVFGFIAFYIMGATVSQKAFQEQSDWTFVGMILFLFLAPSILEYFLGKKHTALYLNSLNWLSKTTIFLTGMSAIMWYLDPAFPRVEPVTFLLGLVAARITYSREQNTVELSKPL